LLPEYLPFSSSSHVSHSNYCLRRAHRVFAPHQFNTSIIKIKFMIGMKIF